MPLVTRLFVKSGLLYLVLYLVLGIVIGIGVGNDCWLSPWLTYRPGQIHALTAGWLTQLIFGIGYWLLPLTKPGRTRGSSLAIWVSFVGINVGLPLRLLVEPVLHEGGGSLVRESLFVLAAGLMLMGALGFVANAWQRIR